MLVGLLLFTYLVAGASSTYDPDMFHALALGREIATRGEVPVLDSFAYTPTRVPTIHHEWLLGLFLYHVVTWGGASALLVVKHAVHALTLGLVLLLARRLGASPVALGFLGPMGVGMSLIGMTTLRAQAVSLGFVAAALWCFELDRCGSRRWIVPALLLYVVWLNCHGGFVVGPLLLVLHAIEQWVRGRPIGHLVALMPVLAALVIVSPYGTAYPAYLWEALRMDRSLIGEWRTLGDPQALALPIWGLSLLVFTYGWLPDGPWQRPGWLLVTASALMAYRHQRHLSIYAVVWLAHVPAMIEHGRLGRTFRRVWFARPLLTHGFLVLGICAAGLHATVERRWELVLPSRSDGANHAVYPIGVVDYVRRHAISGRMVTPFELGAFVSWKLHPAIRVSLDGRYEAAYEPALLVEHVAFYGGRPAGQQFLETYPSDFVLAKRTDSIVSQLRSAQRWHVVYEDDAFMLFAGAERTLPYEDRRGERLTGTFP